MNLIRLDSFGILLLAFLFVRRDLSIVIYAVMSSEVCQENPMEGRLAVDKFKGDDDCYHFGPQTD